MLHLLYATGLRLSELVAATVDDLQWVKHPADASDDQPLQGTTTTTVHVTTEKRRLVDERGRGFLEAAAVLALCTRAPYELSDRVESLVEVSISADRMVSLRQSCMK